MSDSVASDQLKTMIEKEWLPAWRVAHRLGANGTHSPIAVDESVAEGVLLAIERGIVRSTGRGSFELPRSGQRAGIFWHGSQTTGSERRSVFFAYEGLITVAMAEALVSRGWSKAHLEFEPVEEAFDLGLSDPRPGRLLIACESKRTRRLVDELVTSVRACGLRGRHSKRGCPADKTGHSKYEGLVDARPELLIVVAPDYRRVFALVYLRDGFVSLVEADDTVWGRPRSR
jgi:hypothetical protein